MGLLGPSVVLLLLTLSKCYGVFDTESILSEAAGEYIFEVQTAAVFSGGRHGFQYETGENCYGEVVADPDATESSLKNNFLDVVNFMEFIQQTKRDDESNTDDAEKFYKVAKAATEYGNTLVAQENLARALGAINAGSSSGRGKRAGAWDAAELFNELRQSVGEEKFKDLLHLNKKVTMAFIIDTSSSMSNDIEQVRDYIRALLAEQKRAGVEAEYIVTTFADGSGQRPVQFKNPEALSDYLSNLHPSIGGDCEEKTCQGIMTALFRSNFLRVRNSVMYVFTDASSKDCGRYSASIKRTLKFTRAPIFFILFDSCKPTIDEKYVQMSTDTGGYTLLIKDKGVYNISDSVNGVFDKSSLICGEASDSSKSTIGQGDGDNDRKKRSATSSRVILVDTSMTRLQVAVTLTPPALLDQVSLLKPAPDSDPCDSVTVSKSTADNTVLFDVKSGPGACPCTGEWRVVYPTAADKFTYSVKSSGDHLVSFDGYFVDEVGPTTVANYEPCLGVEEKLVIKLNQGGKVNTNTLKAKILAVAGNKVYWEGDLSPFQNSESPNAFIETLTIPPNMGTEGFRIVLEGLLIDGTPFQRTSSQYFYPTSSCMRITEVGKFYSLNPSSKTVITVMVRNNNHYEEVYQLGCSNSENYDTVIGLPMVETGRKGKYKSGRSNPIVLQSGQTAKFLVNITGPKSKVLMNGRTVTVECIVTTSEGELMDVVRLTELSQTLSRPTFGPRPGGRGQ